MKVLSLDLSTKSSGWAIFDNKSLITYGCITCPGKIALDRIPKTIEELKNILDEYQPDKVVIEDVLPEDVNHNQTVFKSLTYLQGYVVIELHSRNMPYEFVTASHWRKECGIRTGRGVRRDSLKTADINFVKENYNKIVNDDIADAVCIGHAFTHPQPQVKIVDGFEFK